MSHQLLTIEEIGNQYDPAFLMSAMMYGIRIRLVTEVKPLILDGTLTTEDEIDDALSDAYGVFNKRLSDAVDNGEIECEKITDELFSLINKTSKD